MKNKSTYFSDNVIEHVFFGREFGSSHGVYASLNCSKFVGDEIASVEQNLDFARRSLHADKLITLHQIHSSACIKVTADSESDAQADAMVTNQPNIALGILTADCAPILLADETNRIIGAAHAGWRGAVHGVIQSTVNAMLQIGADVKNIKSAIGPCIAEDSYEVDDDFKREFAGEGDCFSLINKKLHFNLPKYCAEQLLDTGISKQNIDIFAVDTFTNPELYFSYRFANKHTNGICGRNLSAICLKWK